MTKRAGSEELLRLVDGELEGGEAAALEAALDEGDRARVASMRAVGEAVRGALAKEREQPLDLWAAIAAKLPTAPSSTESAAEAPSPAPVDELQRARQRRGWLRRPLQIVLPIAVAAAAALAFIVTRGGSLASITNGCDIESLEVAGSAATVLKLHDDAKTTVIWTTEE